MSHGNLMHSCGYKFNIDGWLLAPSFIVRAKLDLFMWLCWNY